MRHTPEGKKILAATIVAALTMVLPLAGNASPACGVLGDQSYDVAGPLGTPRPTPASGGGIDIISTSMTSYPDRIFVDIIVRNLSDRAFSGTGGSFYTTFWSLGAARFFAQASLVPGAYAYSAGPAAGINDAIPQQGTPVDGAVFLKLNKIRVIVPREVVGSPKDASLLQQIRAGTQESVWHVNQSTAAGAGVTPSMVAAGADRAGGPEGGRFLLGRTCIPSLSGAGERCLIAADSPRDASGGTAGDTTFGTPASPQVRASAAGAADPATEIVSLQMGSNEGTVIAEIGVGALDQQIPAGSDGERWEVTWTSGARAVTATAERRTTGTTFSYRLDQGTAYPTTGSIDTDAATIRILVPRYEIRAAGITRMTGILATSSLIVGAVPDVRDSAPNQQTFATQFVAGLSCAEQEKAACPVVLDPMADAGAASSGVPQNQDASDMLAAGVAAPSGSLIVSMRLADIGAPPPDGFSQQGWTFSWTHDGFRWFAQAERTRDRVIYRYGLLGDARDYQSPSGPKLFGGTAAEGVFDLQAGVLRISVPRDRVGLPQNGALLTDVGAQSWILRENGVAGTEASPYVPVDTTPIAPYRVGLSCGA